MKFTDGFWMLRPGVKASYAQEAYELYTQGDSLVITAPSRVIQARGNVLNLPVGVVPVTHVRPTDVATVEWTSARVGGGHGSPILERLLYGWADRNGHGWGGYYNPVKMSGIPVGVQVVGRPWEEEKVVEMMKVVDHALGPRDFGPFCWQEQRD